MEIFVCKFGHTGTGKGKASVLCLLVCECACVCLCVPHWSAGDLGYVIFYVIFLANRLIWHAAVFVFLFFPPQTSNVQRVANWLPSGKRHKACAPGGRR